MTNEHEAHKEATMFETEDELIDLCKTIASGEAGQLASNEFAAKFVWMDEKRGPRLFMFPNIDTTDRDDMLRKISYALHVLCSTNRAQHLAFVVDSYQCSSATKSDGTPWSPGDMERAYENKTVDADLVFEAFTITVTDRNGWNAIVSVPYYRDGAGGILFEWDKAMAVTEKDGSGQTGGAFASMMGQAMTTPNLLDEYAVLQHFADTLGVDDERRDVHIMCAAVKKVMLQTGFPCAIAASSEVERETLEASFSEENFGTEFIEP